MTDRDAPSHWHAQHTTLHDFARILTAADNLVTATDVLDYLDSPHAYNREHDLWVRSGRPCPPVRRRPRGSEDARTH